MFRFQDFATHLPDTRNLTPETYINYRRASCPAGATFSERSLGKSLVPIYSNPIMFAKDLCHSQIEYFSLRLVDPTARRGMLSILLERQSEASGSQGLYAYASESDTTNLQYSIFNSGLAGLGLSGIFPTTCCQKNEVSVFRFQRRLWPEKRPVKSEKKL